MKYITKSPPKFKKLGECNFVFEANGEEEEIFEDIDEKEFCRSKRKRVIKRNINNFFKKSYSILKRYLNPFSYIPWGQKLLFNMWFIQTKIGKYYFAYRMKKEIRKQGCLMKRK
jgi:hypothetical protein